MLLEKMAIICSVAAWIRAVWYSDEAANSDIHNVKSM